MRWPGNRDRVDPVKDEEKRLGREHAKSLEKGTGRNTAYTNERSDIAEETAVENNGSKTGRSSGLNSQPHLAGTRATSDAERTPRPAGRNGRREEPAQRLRRTIVADNARADPFLKFRRRDRGVWRGNHGPAELRPADGKEHRQVVGALSLGRDAAMVAIDHTQSAPRVRNDGSREYGSRHALGQGDAVV